MIYLAVDAATGSVVVGVRGPSGAAAGRSRRIGRATPTSAGSHSASNRGRRTRRPRRRVERGGALVVYTDGVIEARRDGEFYGVERLIELVGASLQQPAAEIARIVMEDCREFAGDLADDCALVVIKR